MSYDDDKDGEENLDISFEPTNDDSKDSFEEIELEAPNPADNDDFEDSFEESEVVAPNPADNDDFEELEASNPADNDDIRHTGTSEMPPDDSVLHKAEASSKVAKKENKAPFFARQLIVLVVLGGIIFIILLVVFIIPLFSTDKTENDMLDKRGAVYIPDQIEKWNPKVVLENLPGSFPGQKEEPYQVFKTDDEILAEIPFSDEALGLAPVQPSSVVSSKAGSSRPETNRNEQQKMVERMPMSDNGLNLNASSRGGGAFNQAMSSSPYASAESYGQSAQDRMSNLLNSVSNSSFGTNTSGTNTNNYDSQNNQGSKQAFNNANSGNVGMQMNGEYSLYSGTIIPAALVTGINTDLPGVVIARVTSNVYSSLDGKHLLIPVGTRLFATYNSSISFAQNRVQVAWNKMIRSDGVEINLGNMPGVDSQGRSGYKGFVNDHPFEYVKALGLIAMFSFIDTKIDNVVDTQDNLYAQNVIADTYSNINKLSGEIITRALDIQPTITIAQGKKINIITNVTMDLPPVENFEVNQRYIRQ